MLTITFNKSESERENEVSLEMNYMAKRQTQLTQST